ncbi:hypothetical protein FACS1894199_15500 [Bacteroidia bacterium]|nr:hypothetical protein FACS1894199_15500 [Bacteroidia bacterium]
MSTFLHLLARSLVHKYDCHFEKLTLIFPNKRAGLFLAAELAKLISKPVWMPEILTITDFIEKHSKLKKVDDLLLLIKLYKAYIGVSGSTESFDDFHYWGTMLLRDFDDIDKNLVDAKALFSNLTALKEIDERFSFLDKEQIEAIKMFWSSFNPEQRSKEQTEFLHVWDKLYPTYQRFHENLLNENLCYEGMGMKYFYEHIEDCQTDGHHIVFAGFNALSVCEQRIFSFFRDKGEATFYWDYDIYYLSDEQHEAGRFIRENLNLFPNELGPEHFNNFRHSDKHIEYISVPSNIGQAKLLPELLKNNINHGTMDSAIVLCDERLLVPVVSSIPEEVGKMNITMGYPVQNTSVAALIYLLMECKKHTKIDNTSETKGQHEGQNEPDAISDRQNKENNKFTNSCNEVFYYYKPLLALLNHKLIKNTCPVEIAQITEDINKNNIVYVSAKKLAFNDLTRSIFVFPNPTQSIPDYLLSILGILSSSDPMIESMESMIPPTIAPIEQELIFTLQKQIRSLKNTLEEERITPDDKLYMQIIRKVLNSLHVPFSGEPLEELQLMGLLETRTLDFKNLIILSANEGNIPKTAQSASFIPYNLRRGFRLPTPDIGLV